MVISGGLLLIVLAVLYVDVKSQENVPGGMRDHFLSAKCHFFLSFCFFFVGLI